MLISAPRTDIAAVGDACCISSGIAKRLKRQVGAGAKDGICTGVACPAKQTVPHASGLGCGEKGVFVPVCSYKFAICGDLVDQVIHACESSHVSSKE